MVRSSQRNERPLGDYSNIGQKGRRTGVTLQDTGIRDEHGMEPLPSFSSPQKFEAVLDDTPRQLASYTADDSMEMAQSTIIEPLEVVRSAKHARRSLPRSVSPRKNLLNGTPRRSVGLLSSPSKNVNNGSPSPSVLLQAPNRQLDFSMGHSLSNGIISPQRTLLQQNPSAQSSSKGKNKRPFDLTGLAREEGGAIYNDENANVVINDINDMIFDAEPIPMGDDTGLGDFDPGSFAEHIEDSIEQDDYDSHIGYESNAAMDQDYANDHIALEPRSISRSNNGRTAPVAQMIDPDASQLSTPGTKRKLGKLKKKKTEVYEDPAPGSSHNSSNRRKISKKKNPPRERDPNIRPPSISNSLSKTAPIRAGSAGPRGGSYQVQRSETPATDSGAFVTRSGRASFKPLASWRGEKVIYGRPPNWETPASVTDIIRTDEVHASPPLRKKSTRKQRAQSELEEIEEEEGEEASATAAVGEDAQWETDVGIKYAQVMTWNQEAGKYDEDESETIEVAYAANAIEMRDIAGADFKFAKTLTLPFFGSGLVHLPPRGMKRLKNSRKMQMVFFVHMGRVTIDVGTPSTRFSLGKGGQWQVPRGNFYAITNESDTRDARVFFAQGCEMQSGVIEDSVNG